MMSGEWSCKREDVRHVSGKSTACCGFTASEPQTLAYCAPIVPACYGGTPSTSPSSREPANRGKHTLLVRLAGLKHAISHTMLKVNIFHTRLSTVSLQCFMETWHSYSTRQMHTYSPFHCSTHTHTHTHTHALTICSVAQLSHHPNALSRYPPQMQAAP